VPLGEEEEHKLPGKMSHYGGGRDHDNATGNDHAGGQHRTGGNARGR
jgi:hypothetical protein